MSNVFRGPKLNDKFVVKAGSDIETRNPAVKTYSKWANSKINQN